MSKTKIIYRAVRDMWVYTIQSIKRLIFMDVHIKYKIVGALTIAVSVAIITPFVIISGIIIGVRHGIRKNSKIKNKNIQVQ